MIKWAIVTSVSPFRVQFDGEERESPRAYRKPKNYTPDINDRVCFLFLNNQYICLGSFN